MKKIITTCFGLLLCWLCATAQDPAYPPAPPAAQNIIAAEYFIDTDPGFDQGTAITLSPGADINNITTVINTSGLTNGVHRVYFRTLSSEGHWSLVSYQSFIVDFDPAYPASPAAAQNIVAAEYFIDTDPGFGLGTAIPVTAALDINNLAASINTSALTNGVHRVYLRTRSNEGKWSITNYLSFTVDFDPSYPAPPAASQNAIAAEYFIDSDPGFGLGTAIPVTAGVDIANINASISTSGLSNGVHRFYIRTLSSEGKWGLTNMSQFSVDFNPAYPAAPAAAQNITAAEYFIDTDPGFGHGTAISITPGTDISNISINADISALNNGEHFLHVRTRGQEGYWSLTSVSKFYLGLLSLNADTVLFGTKPTGATATRYLDIVNNSNSDQTVNSLTIGAPFSTVTSAPFIIPVNSDTTLTLEFTPVAVGSFVDSIVLSTATDNYSAILLGTGIAPLPNWAIIPASGHDYGSVATGSSASFSFSIHNSGNADITLSGINSSDPAFVPAFTAGTVIAPGSSTSFSVSFNPAAVAAYAAQLSIVSSTNGVNNVTTQVTGSGYNPGAPPVLSYVAAVPYGGNNGVNPAVGQTGDYIYKILYQSPNNLPPQTGYPQAGIDLNGDQDFNDIGEGVYTMTKEGSSTDYVSGVVYAYTFTHTQNRSTAGYRFFAKDANGNDAAALAYKAGPIVTDDQPDLRIFADNISFSNANPQPGETFTITATVSNSTDIPAANVPVRFYRDTIYMFDDVIPFIGANSTGTITKTLSFAAEGFYPIKVWVDSSNTLGDINPLNNYAIRPVTVGNPQLPGGINATTSASVQQCPELKVIITGHAEYYGTGSPTAVAGANVTIVTPFNTVATTTDVNGNYSYALTGVTCGGNFEHSVTVTDYTFTSQPANSNIPLPCPPLGACAPPPSQGGITTYKLVEPCKNKVGDTLNVKITVQYRDRNPSNYFSSLDEVTNDTVFLFVNDTIKYMATGAALGGEPGKKIELPVVKIPMLSQDPLTVYATLNYTYTEYQSAGEATSTKIIGYSNQETITPEPNLPDLVIRNFKQTGTTAFAFDDGNIRCAEAGTHSVRIYDSLPNGTLLLLRSDMIPFVPGGAGYPLSYSDVTLSPGTHYIKVVTDVNEEIDEVNDDNNSFMGQIFVPATDLTVQKIWVTPTNAEGSTEAAVYAIIKNTGKACGTFKVQFALDDVPVGGLLEVPGINEKTAITVFSDGFFIPVTLNDCAGKISVYADFTDEVFEGNNNDNNKDSIFLSADIKPYHLPNEAGSSAGNPVIVRVNTTNQFFPAIRNVGYRDAKNVTVSMRLNAQIIATDSIATVKAGETFPAHAMFSYMFTAPGNYAVRVVADTADNVCEIDETNNDSLFYIRVVDSNPDFEVLSQYISPSSLNPNAGQNITLVGTVRNSGGKITGSNKLRFMVDDVQVGSDVNINALLPGRDTTVAATGTYSSAIPGVKIVRLVADPLDGEDEEREDNNEATRAIIVGDAPDLSRKHAGAIYFNPNGFVAGDSVLVSFAMMNNGQADGSAWVRFLVLDADNSVLAIDSLPFTLAAGSEITVSKRMKFDVSKGKLVTQIVNATPFEFDQLNNSDTLAFDKIMPLQSDIVISSDLDMKDGAPEELPGWIGGKLLLGDYDLEVHGTVLNYDTAHFIITNGAGRLKLVNSNAANIFPIGPSLYSTNFLQLANSGAADNFSARVLPFILKNGTAGDTIHESSVNRTWLIEEETAGGSNVAATFFWNTADELPGFDRSVSAVGHYYPASWQFSGPGAAANAGVETFSRQEGSYTAFSPFIITSGVNVFALPLHFLSFELQNKSDRVVLQWKTESEVNTSHFIVERSADGVHFDAIGNVVSANTGGVHDYGFDDLQPLDGTSYYRLKQVDIDGALTYSNTLSVNRSSRKEPQVFPNPAGNTITLKNVITAELSAIQVIAADGKTVRRLSINNTLQYDISSLSNGLYQLMIIAKDGTIRYIPFIKQ